MDHLELIATSAFGLESVVRQELKNLGYDARITGAGKIRFSGDLRDVCRANLWLRSADRVLILVHEFEAKDFEALFETTKSIPWEQWIPIDGKFPVMGRSRNSQLSSVPAIQRSTKRAVVDRMLSANSSEGETASLPESGALYRIEISILDDQATLTIDTTGPSLHKRGYRKLVGPAPLKETLAAALVQLSFWDSERPLLDPFCGTGTIPIEAAMIARNIAPGLNREFSFEAWPQVAVAMVDEERLAATNAIVQDAKLRIIGTDSDANSVSMARYHAQKAGVDEDIHFQQKPFHQVSSKQTFGCVITNPPYGERIGESAEVNALYRSIPEILRRFPTWSHFILTAFPNFEQFIQKTADRRRKLYNGRLECTYYQFFGPKPRKLRKPDRSVKDSESGGSDSVENVENDSVEATAKEAGANGNAAHVRVDTHGENGNGNGASSTKPNDKPTRAANNPVFGGLTEKADEQAAIFASRLRKRARHLRRWPTRQDIHCFRLYERDIPEIPLVVDRYEDHLHITEYERPNDRDIAQHADWLELMAQTVGEALDVPTDRIFFKSRQRQRGDTQYEPVSRNSYELEVREGGLKFFVNLSDYVDTGLFLDHRITRAMFRDHAKDARVLNLFAYTGAFSVYAADAPAATVTTVDWSTTYLNWARRNMELNGFVGAKYAFVRENAGDYVNRLPERDMFDLAIIDPPTFSNSKRTEDDWQVQRDHANLLAAVMARVSDGGSVFFSTNFRRFKLAETEIGASSIHEISRQTVPEDYRNRRIHRCWIIKK
ncbi:MAG: bifunctional 23S rRNA (guanine(2069)-N(7))-methyltransferase RlmK/23S rRNA (guanine(2445)-N(2))-methyltransferase RlmL [Planctomycetales bacterium]|nr:bifunctional 23S rRNA (guanine(2069)-N(7))-methyltransferase RlmK/23S rRNA (guanine(2445)-N(2))-methyltransferase RlmL [Planctomycetales bacterium]